MSTLNELVARYNELAVAAGKPTRKSFDNKAKAEAAIKELTPSKRRTPRTAKVHEKGPRGWIFGPKWLISVKSASGIATKMQNLPKLIDFAQSLGVSVKSGTSQETLVKTLSEKL